MSSNNTWREPQHGGSYRRDAQTGEITLVEGTQQRPGDDAGTSTSSNSSSSSSSTEPPAPGDDVQAKEE